jgi:hypothetical protein
LKDAHASEIEEFKIAHKAELATLTLEAAWAKATADEKMAELAKLNVGGLLRLVPSTTKAALERRVVQHLTVADLLTELGRKLPGAPPSPKVRAAFKALEKALLP